MKNDDFILKDCSKVVYLNICIESQNKVSSKTKNTLPRTGLMTTILIKNTILTAGNVESSKNRTKDDLWLTKIPEKKGI